ncbi:hypothetical protein [Lutibacter citreus]|uniref:hypothetical protein n=1 Tax=Lutibacter citreus TaxID=2138210 RepID=UPI000DBE91C0|nr:hypothetical protein [Lutibacter citreus]
MKRTLNVSGQSISQWAGVQVWQGNRGIFRNITAYWNWSRTFHQHYEVVRYDDGSFWVPASTNPPAVWGGYTQIVGTVPTGVQPVNPNGTEFRPDTTYIWIPYRSIPQHIIPGITTNQVVCGYPLYPPIHLLEFSVNQNKLIKSKTMKNQKIIATHNLLDAILAPEENSQSNFQDKDGLISFVNLSSSFVKDNKEFELGQQTCDKISNFIATLRTKVFDKLSSGALKPVGGDPKPKTQWDKAVTHYMFYLLTEMGGLTNFSITSETYSVTQFVMDFNTAFVKILFDAAVVPEAIIGDISSFIGGVGESLRFSWDDKKRTYNNVLLGQCHEAVPMDSTGDYRYFPKIKYYHIVIDSSQQEFTTPCTDTKKVTFNFKYEYYVTGLNSDLFDKKSQLYKDFNAFLDKAQQTNAKDANNKLDQILDGTVSDGLNAKPSVLGAIIDPDVNVFGVDLNQYPKVKIQPESAIQSILNH